MAPGQTMDVDPVVRIGERCSIGRGSHIVGHRSIEIGDDVTSGPYVYVTDQNHVYTDVEAPIGRQWPVEDPVVIGAGSWLGADASCCRGRGSAATSPSPPGRWCGVVCPTARGCGGAGEGGAPLHRRRLGSAAARAVVMQDRRLGASGCWPSSKR